MTAAALIGFIIVVIYFAICIGLFNVRNEAAVARAEALIREHLTPTQLEELNRSGSLRIASRARVGRSYAVPIRGFVTVFQDDTPVMRLCIQPTTALPGREAVLAHKMYIEAAEEDYLQRANVMWRSAGYGLG